VVGAIIGQVLGMLVWMFGHELANRRHMHGPRIVTFLNRTVGRLNNHVALWVTALALPVFIILRLRSCASTRSSRRSSACRATATGTG